jgi:hypothetical protein
MPFASISSLCVSASLREKLFSIRGMAPMIAAPLLCAGFTAMCDVSHSALAVTFGGLAVVTLALPPLAVACEGSIDLIFVTATSVLGVIAVWLTLEISWSQWLACDAVLAAYAGALASSAFSMNRWGMPSILSAAIVMIISLAWLAWPIWLSPCLAGHETLVNWLAFAHPPLAINGVLIDQGIWTERPRMYGWTALNQDVSYSMPSSVLWCVVLHGGVAASFICCSFRHRFNSRRQTAAGTGAC